MTEQLKPCPFCGGSAIVDNGPTYLWYVQCQECRIDGEIRSTKSEAIEAWNRRAQPAQAGAEPVAWMYFDSDGDAIFGHPHGYRPEDAVPVYTHPPAQVPLTADDMKEPKNGQTWRVEWWNESCRMMLPTNKKLDSFTSYKNGTVIFTIKDIGGKS